MRMNNSRRLVILATCGLAASAFGALDGAIAEPQQGHLGLRTGQVRLAELPNLLQARGKAFQEGKRYVIELDGPLTPERDRLLTAAGVARSEYLPTNCFLADLAGSAPEAIAAVGFVRSVVEYQPEWRLDPAIGQRQYQTESRRQLAARGVYQVGVYLFEDAPVEPVLAALGAIPGANVVAWDLEGSSWTVNVEATPNALQAIAQLDAVQFVEDYPDLTFRNGTNRWIVQSNINGVFPLYDHGIRGEGQILGHMDGRVAEPHCSFDDTDPIGPDHRKIIAYLQSQGYDTHGTHTAGTAVGDGGSDTNTRGVAYLARMVHNGIPNFTETAMYSRLDLHYGTYGATDHTNSWGDDGTTAYTALCRAIDRFSWDFEENLVLFAVTNTSTLKTPENAKNCLAVGASQDTPNQGNFCSGGRGPTNDGRRKPEIYAPGCNTNSSTGASGCSTTQLTGTSMASPAVTGTALLVRQYFADGFYPSGGARAQDQFTPTGALVKAALLNGAVDMTGISGYPSDTEGWGRVLADNALYFSGEQRTLIVRDARNRTDDGITTGENVEFAFNVDGSTDQLRVTLVWHDTAAAINANPAYVNDLDLEVVRPDLTVYKGNVFSGGVSISGGSPDPKNNVEQVHVSAPTQGAWTVRVKGTAVQTGTDQQGYALVITGQVSEGCASDCDNDGVCDSNEADCDGDGVPDDCQTFADCDGNGLPDECDPGFCAADMNRDGTLNVFDFLAYQSQYANEDACADLAEPFGSFNVFDFLAFQGYFSNGC